MRNGLRDGGPGRRLLAAFALVVALASVWALIARANDDNGAFRFTISFPAARGAQPLDGRVLLFISDDGRTEPRTQTDQYRANSTRPIFGIDVDS
ncbi:MAG TPA: hypothetical protein VKH42_00515, partial [Vicinamibacterales bacterium]|nr:hypothetical protein [Vicinamibacterales bacterium]